MHQQLETACFPILPRKAQRHATGQLGAHSANEFADAVNPRHVDLVELRGALGNAVWRETTANLAFACVGGLFDIQPREVLAQAAKRLFGQALGPPTISCMLTELT